MWEVANRLWLCRRCHDRHETGYQRIPAMLLPRGAIEFADRLGLLWRIERDYASR
jgi:hypothetical protein